MTHVEINRFRHQCSKKFQPKSVEIHNASILLLQWHKAVEELIKELGVSSDEDLSFIDDSDVLNILSSLPIVPRIKLRAVYHLELEDTVKHAKNDTYRKRNFEHYRVP